MTLSDSRPGRQLIWRLGTRPPTTPGLPRCPRYLSGVPSPLPPVNRTGASDGFFPARAAFPEIQTGRRSRLHFRGLLRVHSRYGPQACSIAQGDLGHEASTCSVTQTYCSSATRLTINYLGGTFLHWHLAPSWRTELSGLGLWLPGSRIFQTQNPGPS